MNAAYRFRPPASTEQIMHPDKYLKVEQPERVRLHAGPGAGLAAARRPAPGASGRPASCVGNPDAAEGWGGDRYELWQRGSGDCARAVPRPRRARHALALGHARAPPSGSRRRCASGPASSPARVAISSRGREVALALAPEADLAQRLVE